MPLRSAPPPSPLPACVPVALRRADSTARLWLRTHARLLSTATDLLHSLALLSPSPHAELRAAVLASLASLLRLYRDYPPSSTLPHAGRILLLNILTSVQLPLEMLVSRGVTPPRSAPAHMSTITAVETAKAALRLSLLRRDRPLTPIDLSLPEPEAPPQCTCGLGDIPAAADVSVTKGPRTDRAILALRAARYPSRPRGRPLSRAVIAGLEPPPSQTSTSGVRQQDPLLDALFVVAYERRANWLVRLFMPDVRCEACSGVVQLPPRPPLRETMLRAGEVAGSLNAREVAAEVAYIVRPVLHLLLVRRLGWRSWRPWALALVVDLASRLAMPAPEDGPAAVERRRRLALLLLYLGRSPVFDLVLRVVIKRITSPLRGVPVVGGIASSAIQWLTLLQQYWFYTSGS